MKRGQHRTLFQPFQKRLPPFEGRATPKVAARGFAGAAEETGEERAGALKHGFGSSKRKKMSVLGGEQADGDSTDSFTGFFGGRGRRSGTTSVGERNRELIITHDPQNAIVFAIYTTQQRGYIVSRFYVTSYEKFFVKMRRFLQLVAQKSYHECALQCEKYTTKEFGFFCQRQLFAAFRPHHSAGLLHERIDIRWIDPVKTS